MTSLKRRRRHYFIFIMIGVIIARIDKPKEDCRSNGDRFSISSGHAGQHYLSSLAMRRVLYGKSIGVIST